VFSEVFLVQICQKFWKICFEVHIQSKKNSKNASRILKSRAKKEIQEEKEGGGGRERIFHIGL
jgi:hypothetical protein